MFIKSFGKSKFPRTSVNSVYVVVMIKDKLHILYISCHGNCRPLPTDAVSFADCRPPLKLPRYPATTASPTLPQPSSYPANYRLIQPAAALSFVNCRLFLCELLPYPGNCRLIQTQLPLYPLPTAARSCQLPPYPANHRLIQPTTALSCQLSLFSSKLI